MPATKAIEYLKRIRTFTIKQWEDILIAIDIAYEEGRGCNSPSINFEVYDEFKKKFGHRFNRNGIIRTGEAWEQAKGIASYSMLCNMMRYHMEEMERKGHAVKIRKGVWIIQYDVQSTNKKKVNLNLISLIKSEHVIARLL